MTDNTVGNVIVTADIQPNYELLEEQRGKMSSSDVYHFYRELVDEINKTLPPYKSNQANQYQREWICYDYDW